MEEEFRKSLSYKVALEKFERDAPIRALADNHVSVFLEELFDEDRSGRGVKAERIQQLYNVWMKKTPSEKIGSKQLGMALKTLLRTKRHSDGIYYIGIEEKGEGEKKRMPTYKMYHENDVGGNYEVHTQDSLGVFLLDYWNKGNPAASLVRPDFGNLSFEEVVQELVKVGFVVFAVEGEGSDE